VECLVRLVEYGYKVVFHVHDEIIAEVLPNFGSLEHFLSLMKVVPRWGTGIPVNATGWKGKRYGKE
jgi:DNA polymerase